MNPLAAFTMLIATAQNLAAAVNTRDDLHLRPQFARKAVAARLVSGLMVLKAFLCRMILLIALDLEWTLVDTRGEMKRPHGRKAKSTTRLNLRILDADKPSPWIGGNCPKFVIAKMYEPKQVRDHRYNPPVFIDMAKLYAQFNFLAGIASNPLPKAKRLAFHIARTREGIIMAPEGPKRIAGRWGTEVNAQFWAMGYTHHDQGPIKATALTTPAHTLAHDHRSLTIQEQKLCAVSRGGEAWAQRRAILPFRRHVDKRHGKAALL
jgi:hypothetical protein